MKFDFDTTVNRKSIGNMKYIRTSEKVLNNGNISFEGAEMDFKTAPVIIEGLTSLCANGIFGFTLADKQYYDKIIWWQKKQRNWDIKEKEIVPTYGTIFSISTTIRAFTDKKNGVIVQPPIYNRYEQAVKRLDRKIIYNPLIYKNNTYSMDLENLEILMSNKNNKLMILCNPHNPIGKNWKEKDLTEIAKLAKKHDVLVFSDEIFSDVVFNNKASTPYSVVKNAAENCIVSTALGKTFNLTGINNANVVIPNYKIKNKFIKQRNADHYGSLDPFTYTALSSAYTQEGHDWVEEMKSYVYENMKYIKDFFNNNLANVKLVEPDSTYVLWMDWNNVDIENKELMNFLEDQAHFQCDSGDNYGIEGKGFIRMNISAPRKEIEKALETLLKALKNIK